MPYTVNDYFRDFPRSHLDWLSVQERLKGLPLKERFKDLSPEEIVDVRLSEDILEHVSPEKWEQFVQKFRQQAGKEKNDEDTGYHGKSP